VTGTDDDPAEFLALTAKIANERGFSVTSYKHTCLRRRILVRMRARGAPDYRAYSRVLDADPLEYDRLLDALTINVTRLFRDPEVWAALDATVLPDLWTREASRLHCWVAGCASGEEAYTLAALWLRFLERRGDRARAARVHITASDIDRASLAAAERGAYPAEAFRDVPKDVQARYFSAEAPHAAAPELRALVRFEERDLLQFTPPVSSIHLITCRNVIIYFDRPSQDALIRRWHDALVPGGFLVLGKVETLLGPARTLFELADQRQRIFRRP
jgi:chemotaxis methyl-accepting protein methylase